MTLRELNREYWGCVHNMCEGTTVKPWECVKYKKLLDKSDIRTLSGCTHNGN